MHDLMNNQNHENSCGEERSASWCLPASIHWVRTKRQHHL